MRAEFCEDVLGKASDQHAVISVFGRSTTQKQALILLVMIAVAILASWHWEQALYAAVPLITTKT